MNSDSEDGFDDLIEAVNTENHRKSVIVSSPNVTPPPSSVDKAPLLKRLYKVEEVSESVVEESKVSEKSSSSPNSSSIPSKVTEQEVSQPKESEVPEEEKVGAKEEPLNQESLATVENFTEPTTDDIQDWKEYLMQLKMEIKKTNERISNTNEAIEKYTLKKNDLEGKMQILDDYNYDKIRYNEGFSDMKKFIKRLSDELSIESDIRRFTSNASP